MNSYTLKYDLEGGIGQNPTSYTEADEIRLNAPLRPGYRFIGWQGSPSFIPKGSQGDRLLSPIWKRIDIANGSIRRRSANDGIDNDLEGHSNPTPISSPSAVGERGQNIYAVKTAYTDIKVDGIKDPAYDYGIHLQSDVSNNPEYYADKNVKFDIYIVRSQNGQAYVFAEVTTPEVFAPDALWRANMHHCDGIHMYSDFGYLLIGADPSNTKKRGTAIGEYKVVLTDKGYNVEYCFDNAGSPLSDGDSLSLSFFACDCVSYESVANHKKNILRISSALSGKEKYVGPNTTQNDTFVFLEESVSGKELINEKESLIPTDDIIADAISGARTVAIVYGENSSAYTITALRALTAHLNSFCMNVRVMDENNSRREINDIEILVGVTSDSQSLEFINTIPYNGYGIKIAGNRIYVVGWLEEALNRSLGLIISAFDRVRMGGKTADMQEVYSGSLAAIPGACVPMAGNFNTVTDAGDGAYCVLIKPAEAERVEKYRSLLKKAGYMLYTSNSLGSLRTYTYFNSDAVITLTYDICPENGNDFRIVVEPRHMTELPPLVVPKYEPKCKSSITQICPNRMTYIVKLDNGEFLVADSGTNKQHSYIYDELMRLSDDGKPVVAVWTFSHFHQDHNGGFVEFVQNEEYMKNVTVKSVIYNTPEQQIISLASPTDKRNMSMWESLLDRHGIRRYQARTGQKYRFANAELDILYTYEDLMPFFIYHDRSNPTSFVYSMKIEGQRFIITGDCCSEASKLMVKRYGKELKADFVQLPHHGHGDGGTSPDFYKLVNADYVLWPGEPARLSPAEREAISKVKKYFVMCEGTVTIDIPYSEN